MIFILPGQNSLRYQDKISNKNFAYLYLGYNQEFFKEGKGKFLGTKALR